MIDIFFIIKQDAKIKNIRETASKIEEKEKKGSIFHP
jgi:hypothetical protein